LAQPAVFKHSAVIGGLIFDRETGLEAAMA
jgi:hypothetical protein